MRLVMAENPGLPSIISHRVSMPSPIAVATSPRSISATPPVSVELMFQMVRPRKRSRVVSANWENWENRSPPMMASNRSAMVGVTLASRMLRILSQQRRNSDASATAGKPPAGSRRRRHRGPRWPRVRGGPSPRTRGHLGPRWRLRRDPAGGLPAVAEASELRRCCDKMRSMREAKVTPTIADRFEAIIGGDRFSQFSQLADTTRERFLGRTIWNINSTETGGVAEMLRGLVATAMGLGIDTRWLMIDGNPGFSAITKRIHNCVHGSPGDGGPLGEPWTQL